MKIEIVLSEKQSTLDECLAIRRKVFIEEQGVDENIEIDEHDRLGGECAHFLITVDCSPLGTFRLTFEGERAHLQRFCILRKERGRGIGTAAFGFVADLCRQRGVKTLYFDAQCTAEGFYRRNGCVTVSPVFTEADMPHVRMEKHIN